MKIKELFESFYQSSLSGYLTSTGIENLPIRLRNRIEHDFVSFEAFVEYIRRFEKRNPEKARRILEQEKFNLLANLTEDDLKPPLREVPFSMIREPDTGIDEFRSQAEQTIITNLGREPRFLYRYVSGAELESIISSEKMVPSSFYGRIHASIEPEMAYSDPTGALLAIRFDKRHQWQAKQASTGIYAVTYNEIQADDLMVVKP